MFKVGDKVTFPRNTGHPKIDSNNGVFTIVIDNPNNTMVTLTDKDGEFWNSSTQHLTNATPEEIAAGHRIDLETLRDCDTSPNCKKYKERVSNNETN